MNKQKYIVCEGRNITVRAGMAHPGHVFAIEEISGEDPSKTIAQLLKIGCIKKHGIDLDEPPPETKPEPPVKIKEVPEKRKASRPKSQAK